jgi:integrase
MAGETKPRRRAHQGIETRHARDCGSRRAEACSCRPTYQAAVWSPRDGKRIRKTFGTLAAARAWRADAQAAVRRGMLKAPTSTTLREAAEAWLAGARDGSIRNRSGDTFKPSVLRGYEAALRSRILPELGGARLGSITRPDLQDLADQLLGEGLDPSTIRNVFMPLRAIYRRGLARAEVAVNPTSGLQLPAPRGRRDRIASPEEAARLLAALSERDRPLWATAMYAGLRRGELMALRFEDIDLAGGVIRVERAWDPKEHSFIQVKSRAGRRRVPLVAVLRDHLVEHKLRTDRAEGLSFGRDAERPFEDSSLRARAITAWRTAGLDPITLHECRHTFASLMIAAGVNAKALSTYLGHASITITLDRYGHLMPGNEEEAAGLLDRFLARVAAETARAAED